MGPNNEYTPPDRLWIATYVCSRNMQNNYKAICERALPIDLKKILDPSKTWYFRFWVALYDQYKII